MQVKFNTFVKADAQIEAECRRTLSYLKGYSYPKLYCKKLNNQKPMANTVSTTREQFYAECGVRLKNFKETVFSTEGSRFEEK